MVVADVKMRKRILLLEDELSNRHLLNFILSVDYHVAMVENGRDAFTWLQNNEQPDLIIMDWIMPVMDGKSFLTSFKYQKDYQHIPIIVLSSYDRIHEELLAIQFQAHSELSKPVNPSVLKAAIARAIMN